MKHRKSKEDRTFIRRTSNIYNSLKFKAGPLDFTLDQFREAVKKTKECPYCARALTVNDFSLDHKIPISLGGSSNAYNMKICCINCNQAKGNMTEYEWLSLLKLIASFSIEANISILARLRCGARFYKR